VRKEKPTKVESFTNYPMVKKSSKMLIRITEESTKAKKRSLHELSTFTKEMEIVKERGILL
jgi:hypothetical protein